METIISRWPFAEVRRDCQKTKSPNPPALHLICWGAYLFTDGGRVNWLGFPWSLRVGFLVIADQNAGTRTSGLTSDCVTRGVHFREE